MTTPHASRPSFRCAQSGASLIEVLVTLTLFGVLAAASVTAWSEVGRSMKLSSFANSYVSQLHLARSEAIKRNGRVVLCKSADGESCASSGGWEQGSIVFHDRNNNAERDAGEVLIRRSDTLPAGYRIAGNAAVARYISFHPVGGTRHISGAFQAGTVTVCRHSVEPTEARQVIINAVGRPRIHRLKVQDCY